MAQRLNVCLDCREKLKDCWRVENLGTAPRGKCDMCRAKGWLCTVEIAKKKVRKDKETWT